MSAIRLTIIGGIFLFFLPISARAQAEEEVINYQGWIDYNVKYYHSNNFGVYADMGARFISPHVWTRYYFRPAASYTLSPSSRSWNTPIITFHLGSGLFYTNNADLPKHIELRPFQGVNVQWPNFKKMRISHYVRVEERFQFTNNTSNFSTRARYMISGTFRFQRNSDNRLSNLYFPFQTEFFWNLDQANLFGDLMRITPGVGYNINADFRLEFSVSYHRSRITSGHSFETDDIVFRLRFFHDIL